MLVVELSLISFPRSLFVTMQRHEKMSMLIKESMHPYREDLAIFARTSETTVNSLIFELSV